MPEPSMLELAMPLLERPVTDVEAALGAGMINHLADLSDQGLTDSTAEVAIGCMLAMYAEHRRELRDPHALDRILDTARKLFAAGRFRLVTGDAYAKAVADEFGAGRLKL